VQPLEPGAVYQLDVEIWPSSLVLPSGYRLGLTVRGRDYEYRDGRDAGAQLSHFKGKTMRRCGIYLHDDAVDRPASVFGGRTTIHTSAERPSRLLLPVLPPEA